MKNITLFTVYATIFTLLVTLINPSSVKTTNFLRLFFSEDQTTLGKNRENTTAAVGSATYFAVGPGEADVIPHQIVRTNTDHLYLIANQETSKVLRVYRTIGTGLPASASDFASIQIADPSNVISVDAAYNGTNFIHVLVNTQDGHIRDYPFNVTTNTFSSSITLASNGGMVPNGYAGTSGVAGMVDLSGNLHVVYWTNTNHIVHRVYSYNSSTNVLSALTSFFQVDSIGGANHPALAISSVDNSLTVAWVSEADNPVRIRTRARSSNGTWGSIQIASTAPVWTNSNSGPINIDQGPNILIDSAGVKHLAYIQSADSSGDYGRIHYVKNTGSGWVDQTLNAYTHDPGIAINSTGEMYIIGHGHHLNPSCLSMDDMCVIKKNSDGTWGNPQLFAAHPGSGQPLDSFDSSPSIKWSAVGFNRPETIEFLFFKTPYGAPTLYYGRLQSSPPPVAISGNAGTADVTLSYVDGITKAVTSQSDGSYSLQVSNGWTGTVTPSHSCYTFNPVNRSYSNLTGNQTGQSYTATFNSASGCANVNVKIGTNSVGNYGIPSGGRVTPTYPGVQTGPVRVTSSLPTFTSERALFGPYNAFNEVMGFPNTQLTDHYWFPWYDNKDMKTWVLVGNPSPSQDANVVIKIGGQQVYSKTLAHNAIDTPQFGVTQTGPVEVTSNIPIITSERALYGPASSFNEVMGFPDNQLASHYWFPWYDNKDMKTWVLVANPSLSQDANVVIKVGGQQVYSKTLAHGAIDTPQFGTLQTGPVEVTSNIPIITSERALFGPYNTFNEVMGFPDNQLASHYWFPWYDNKDMRTWILVANPDNSLSANVVIKIGGQQVYSKTLAHNAIDTPQFGTTQNGPVEVISSIPIITSERALYGPASSFNEVMGYPDSQLTTDYWFTWYDNKDMTTWVLVGKP